MDDSYFALQYNSSDQKSGSYIENHSDYDNNDSDSDDDEEDELTREIVLKRIETLAASIIERLDNCEMPIFGGGDTGTTATTTTALSSVTTKIKRFDLHQCRSFTSILLVLAYCHSLIIKNLTTTTREVYYFYVTHFRTQRECDMAINDACYILHVPRYALHLQASSRGWLCGNITIQYYNNNNNNNSNNNNNNIDNEQRIITANHAAIPVSPDWLLPTKQRPFGIVTTPHNNNTTAKSILVIEKEGIFQRLVQDGFHIQHNTILITGKGFPDQATRAAVYHIHKTFHNLPVYGLADCDPFGVMVLHCYSDINSKYSVPLQWLGLRPSQVQQLAKPDSNRQALPKPVFQELTNLDQKRLQDHLLDETHTFTATNDPYRYDELVDMLQRSSKVELEALYWLGMDFCSEFVGFLLENAISDNNNNIQNSNYDDENNETPQPPQWMNAI